MLRFIDMLEDIEVQLDLKDIDYIEHTLEAINVVDVEGKIYLTKIVFVEDE